MEMIDTHAHIYLCEGSEEDLIKNAHAQNVSQIINVAIDVGSSRKVLAQYNRNQILIPTAGIHPCEVENNEIEDLQALLAQEKAFKAIGECGLDYYWRQDNQAKQKKYFEAQLKLAIQHQLPVIIHNRKADEDIITLANAFPDVKKVFHCFSGGPEMVKRLENPNHFFSFTGQITYAKKGKTIQAIKALPLEKIMLETDAPYLTPKAFKGQKNQPAFLIKIAEKIAEIKAMDLNVICNTSTVNAKRFFDFE